MALQFTRANSEYVEVDAAPLTATPLTMACWFYSSDVTNEQTLMNLVDKSSTDGFRLSIRGNAGDVVSALVDGVGLADTSTSYSVTTWHHAAAVFTSSTSRAVFIDGGSKGTNATSGAPAGIDRFSIGRYGQVTPTHYMSGRIAIPAIWSVALSDGEVAALAAGAHPLEVQPHNLVYYDPFIRVTGSTRVDRIWGTAMTETNTPTDADHPPLVSVPLGVA